jgi:hypothetical protein
MLRTTCGAKLPRKPGLCVAQFPRLGKDQTVVYSKGPKWAFEPSMHKLFSALLATNPDSQKEF